MKVVIDGYALPGIRCGPNPDGAWYEDVRVGLCCRDARRARQPSVPRRPWWPSELVAGDAPTARWEFEVGVRSTKDCPDFTGPYVLGARGDRHVGLAWGEVPGDGSFRLFRLATLPLEGIDSRLIERAAHSGDHLVARLRLTNAKGHPICARVGPPDLTWSVQVD